MPDNTDLPVALSEEAIADLSAIGRWIAERADTTTADSYVSNLKAACFRLSFFPNRGTPRFDVGPGLRTVTHQRRTIIVYRVENGVVQIVRLIDTARDFRRAMAATRDSLTE